MPSSSSLAVVLADYVNQQRSGSAPECDGLVARYPHLPRLRLRSRVLTGLDMEANKEIGVPRRRQRPIAQ